MRNIKKGFTLIELLIVVAIIAILAAIAVPNFLEAQVRAKVSRCQADMRTLATALTTYKIDTNKWPHDGHYYNSIGIAVDGMNDGFVYAAMTTPIAYITSIPIDGFQGAGKAVDGNGAGLVDVNPDPYYWYYSDGWIGAIQQTAPPVESGEIMGEWLLASPGPDKSWGYGEWNIVRWVEMARAYDSTNGTVSYGDIVRFGP